MTAEAISTHWPRSGVGSDRLGLATIGLMLACLLLGGASRENALLVAFLELLALPLAVVAGWRLAGAHGVRSLAAPLVILAAIFLVPLLQLVPLPFETWAGMAGRADLAEAMRQAGAAPDALAMSVTPDMTWRSALALLPPTAVFLAAVQMSPGARRRAVEMVLVVVLASIVLGLLQIATGADSPLRPYETTNAGSAVGLFANRNHQAALLVVSIPLAAAWAVDRGDRPVRWLALALAVLAVAGVGAARSRAGVLLAAPALLGALLVIMRGAKGQRGRRGLGLAFGSVAVIGALATAISLGSGVMDRFEEGPEEEMRLRVLPQVLSLADDYAPFGSGIGSFDPAYRVVEPVDTMGPGFLNHAHNDYAEVWVEAGVVGAVLVAAFVLWFAIAAVRLWAARGRDAAAAYNRAATLVILVLLVHSAVDYPLRTLALAGIFAFACALVAAPAPLPRR